MVAVDDKWKHFRSPNFELYSRNEEKSSRELLHNLELLRAAFFDRSKLIERAQAGEEVIIARAGSPCVRLTPVEPPPPKREKGAWLGALRGQIWIAPGSEKPDEELTQVMEEGPVFPPFDPEA